MGQPSYFVHLISVGIVFFFHLHFRPSLDIHAWAASNSQQSCKKWTKNCDYFRMMAPVSSSKFVHNQLKNIRRWQIYTFWRVHLFQCPSRTVINPMSFCSLRAKWRPRSNQYSLNPPQLTTNCSRSVIRQWFLVIYECRDRIISFYRLLRAADIFRIRHVTDGCHVARCRRHIHGTPEVLRLCFQLSSAIAARVGSGLVLDFFRIFTVFLFLLGLRRPKSI